MSKQVSRNRTLVMAHASLEAKRRLDQQRIGMPIRPNDEYPELPSDPTELTDSELMRLFVRLTKWAEYLSTQLAVAEVDESYADEYLSRVKAIKALSNTGVSVGPKGGAVRESMTLVKAKAYEDEDFLAAHDRHQEAYAYRKLIGVKYTNAERNSTLLSRELTRRVNRDAREGRVERWQA